MSKIKNYKMNLNVLTPVHIGGAEYKTELSTSQYAYEERKKTLTIIDTAKFVDLLNRRNLFEEYVDFIQKRANPSKNEQNRKVKVIDFIKLHKLEAEISNIAEKQYKNFEFDGKNGRLNKIKLFVKDVYGNPFIPGSSIKGAIINSLLVDYIIRNRNELKDNIDRILKESRKVKQDEDVDNYKKAVSREVSEIESLILYGETKPPKIRKFGISISDTYKSEDLTMSFFQDIDEIIKDEKLTFIPLAREYVMPKSQFYCDIALDFDRFEIGKLKIESMDDILDAIERATSYLTTKSIPLVREEIDLILGSNTGFHQKTIIHALFDKPKERLDVTKALLHKNSEKKITAHLNDKYAPRVVNRVGWDYELAGIVQLSFSEEDPC